MSVLLTHWEGDLLFRLLVAKWKNEQSSTLTSSKSPLKIIGYSTKKKSESSPVQEHTLCKHINKVLSIPGEGITAGYLYHNIIAKLGKGHSDAIMELKDPQATWLFNYLNYDDYAHFNEKAYKTTSYTGFYFSRTHFRISEFQLDIRIPPATEGTVYPARHFITTHGFHDNVPKLLLTGELKHQDRCWVSHVVNGNYFLLLALYTEHEFSDINAVIGFNNLFGSLTTVGQNNKLINIEFVLLKTGYSDQTVQTIKRFLNVRRHYFALDINENNLQTVEALEMANRSVNSLHDYTGKTFRVLSKGGRGQYIQSRFRIEADYRAFLNVYDVEKGEDLRCYISIDNMENDMILVYSFVRSRVSKLYTTTGIKLEKKLSEKTVLKGAYFVVDSQLAKLKGLNFVLIEDKTDIELGKFSKDEIDKKFTKDNKIHLLVTKL